MAVVSVNEVWDGNAGSEDSEGVRSYVRAFNVITNSLSDGAATVLAAWTLPRVMDVYADRNGTLDTGARCKDRKADRDSRSPFLWKVTCSYDTKPREEKEKDKQEEENPLARPARISFSSNARKIVPQEDINGKPLVNSAGDPFSDPPEVTEYNLVVEVEKNLPFFDPTVIFRYEGAVNANTFLGFDANTVLCKSITASSQDENGILFWQVKVTFEITKDESGWQTLILDTGTNEWIDTDDDGAGDLKVPIYLGTPREAVKKPVPLNGAGQYLELVDAENDPVFLDFQFFPLIDFSGLALFA